MVICHSFLLVYQRVTNRFLLKQTIATNHVIAVASIGTQSVGESAGEIHLLMILVGTMAYSQR